MSIFEEFTNCNELEELQKAVNSISPGLRLSRFGLAQGKEKRAISAGLVIMEKGHKQVIEKLFSIGFKKTFRERTRNGYADSYSGYSFVLTLEKPL